MSLIAPLCHMNSLCARLKEIKSFRRKNPICDCSRCNQMPKSDEITCTLLLACAPISKLTSNISTMGYSNRNAKIMLYLMSNRQRLSMTSEKRKSIINNFGKITKINFLEKKIVCDKRIHWS